MANLNPANPNPANPNPANPNPANPNLAHPNPANPTLTLTLTLTPGFARRATELWRKAAPLQPDMLHLGLFRCLGIP